MISDADSTVSQPARESKPAPRAASAPAPAPAERARSTDDQEPDRPVYQAPAQSSGGSSTGKWLLGIGVVAGLLWLVSQSGDKASSPAPAFTPSSDASSVASPSPSWQPAPSQPPAPIRPSEERPPVGTNNVLTSAQLRYCVAEKIRLDAAEGVISNYNETQVDRFNEMVADYNGRCGQFRYRSGALESARADVDRFRGTLEADGRARFAAGGSASPKSRAVIPEKSGSNDEVSRSQSSLSTEERDSIESACSTQKVLDGPAAYNSCVTSKLRALKNQGARPDVSQLSMEERESIESACSTQKVLDGPAAYNSCVASKLRALKSQGARPDVSQLSAEERDSIESACSTQKVLDGPAAYNACVSSKLRALRNQGARPDVSKLTSEERDSIESACSTQKVLDGPAAYNACVSRQVARLRPR